MIETESKIKVRVSQSTYTTIMRDIEVFRINKNKICNIIISRLYNKYKAGAATDILLYKDIQFSLNKENHLFNEIMKNKPTETKADVVRDIFVTYCEKSPFEREKILFAENVRYIERAVKKCRKIVINYKGEYRVITPYFIAASKEEEFNYVVCRCDKKKMYIPYRLSNISVEKVTEEDGYVPDNDYIKGLKENFDPFLSYGHKLVVKMNEAAEKRHVNTMLHNKPKGAKNNETGYWEFECAPMKAIVYFSGFIGEVAIISPENVRNDYMERCRKAIEMHESSCI